jgi:hypothetical protein
MRFHHAAWVYPREFRTSFIPDEGNGRFRINTTLFRPPLESLQDGDDNEARFFYVSGYATT